MKDLQLNDIANADDDSVRQVRHTRVKLCCNQLSVERLKASLRNPRVQLTAGDGEPLLVFSHELLIITSLLPLGFLPRTANGQLQLKG